jgi:uncharacterized protein
MTTRSYEASATLVTGASRGLGKALSEELARRGARVVLVGREREPLEAVAHAIPSRAPGPPSSTAPACACSPSTPAR